MKSLSRASAKAAAIGVLTVALLAPLQATSSYGVASPPGGGGGGGGYTGSCPDGGAGGNGTVCEIQGAWVCSSYGGNAICDSYGASGQWYFNGNREQLLPGANYLIIPCGAQGRAWTMSISSTVPLYSASASGWCNQAAD